jgi:hypothetical protein
MKSGQLAYAFPAVSLVLLATLGSNLSAHGMIMRYSVTQLPGETETVSGTFEFDPDNLNTVFTLSTYKIVYNGKSLAPNNSTSDIRQSGDWVDVVISPVPDVVDDRWHASFENGLPPAIGDVRFSTRTTPKSKVTKIPLPVPAPLPILGAVTALSSFHKLRRFSSLLKNYPIG